MVNTRAPGQRVSLMMTEVSMILCHNFHRSNNTVIRLASLISARMRCELASTTSKYQSVKCGLLTLRRASECFICCPQLCDDKQKLLSYYINAHSTIGCPLSRDSCLLNDGCLVLRYNCCERSARLALRFVVTHLFVNAFTRNRRCIQVFMGLIYTTGCHFA